MIEGYYIIAQRGTGEVTQYLLMTPEQQVLPPSQAWGRVLDLERGVLYAPQRVQVILKWGYWQPYQGDQSWLKDVTVTEEQGDGV